MDPLSWFNQFMWKIKLLPAWAVYVICLFVLFAEHGSFFPLHAYEGEFRSGRNTRMIREALDEERPSMERPARLSIQDGGSSDIFKEKRVIPVHPPLTNPLFRPPRKDPNRDS